jgi:hypothetical protein
MRAAFRVPLPFLLLTSCASLYYTRPGTFHPAVGSIAPSDRSAVWQRAITALLDEGYVPQVLNEAGGYISARRREDLVEDTSLVGTMATVVVAADGQVRVEVSGTGVYYSEGAFVAAITNRQQRLLARILGQPLPN